MVKSKKQLLFLITLFFIAQASALTIDINMKDEFNLNEEISFTYSIFSDAEEQIKYSVGVECSSAPIPEFIGKEETINAGQTISDTFTYPLINKNIESQTCKAIVAISEPLELIKEKEFLIQALETFSFSLDFEKKIFILGENININYESDISPDIITNLIYPDGTTGQIILPITIKAEQIGTYTLEVVASKEGYKNIEKTEQFAVLEEQIQIQDNSICNINGKCNGEETYQNCPQDCVGVASVKPGAYDLDKIKQARLFYFIFLFTIIVLIILSTIGIIYLKKKKLKISKNKK